MPATRQSEIVHQDSEVRADLNAALALLSFRDKYQPHEMTKVREIRLHLHDMRDLFIAPEFDPFSQTGMLETGIDYLINAMKPSQLSEHFRAVILLPEDKPQGGQASGVRAAIARYCQHRICTDHNELASLRWQAFKALQSGVLFLAACLLLSALADGAAFLPEGLRRLGSEGFLIAGWVSIWHPTELFLYDWWPTWRDIQVCKRLMEMEVVVEADTSASN